MAKKLAVAGKASAFAGKVLLGVAGKKATVAAKIKSLKAEAKAKLLAHTLATIKSKPIAVKKIPIVFDGQYTLNSPLTGQRYARIALSGLRK